MLRLVDQHLRLVLQRRDLVVDLLQLARRRQHVLRVVVGIEHDQLRRGGTRLRSDGKRDRRSQQRDDGDDHDEISMIREIGDEIGRPGEPARREPAGDEAVAAMLGENTLDQRPGRTWRTLR